MKISFFHVGGPLTMSVEMFERFVADLLPNIVIPIHINDFTHYQTREEDLIKKGFKIQKQGQWVELDLGCKK